MSTARSTSPTTLRPRRNLRWLLAGVLAICLGGLGSAMLYSSVSGATSVLRVNRTIHRGELISATDLGAVSLGSHVGLETIAADRAGELIGKTALVDLPSGSLVVPGSVGAPVLARGQARVGIQVKAGRVPVSALPAGTPVVLVPFARDNQGQEHGAAIRAEIAVAPVVQDDGSVLLEVTVADSESERVARLAAAEQLAVIRRSV